MILVLPLQKPSRKKEYIIERHSLPEQWQNDKQRQPDDCCAIFSNHSDNHDPCRSWCALEVSSMLFPALCQRRPHDLSLQKPPQESEGSLALLCSLNTVTPFWEQVSWRYPHFDQELKDMEKVNILEIKIRRNLKPERGIISHGRDSTPIMKTRPSSIKGELSSYHPLATLTPRLFQAQLKRYHEHAP